MLFSWQNSPLDGLTIYYHIHIIITMSQELGLPELVCKRCGHEWIPRSYKLPTQCPRCHSPYWNTTKWKGIEKKEEPQPGPKPQAQKIGQCIYCNTTKNLSTEHIIPEGLLGIHSLEEASCKKCHDITSAFELRVLRDYFNKGQTSLKLPTRNSKKRSKFLDYTIRENGIEKVVSIPDSDITSMFMMPTLGKPGYLTGKKSARGFSVRGTSLHGNQADIILKKLQDSYDAENINFTVNLDNSFPRLLAKIAYGMVVMSCGLDEIQEAFVLPSILGKKDDIGMWVGCNNPDQSPASLPSIENVIHFMELEVDDDNVISANIRLFQSFQTPQYVVVVGRLS